MAVVQLSEPTDDVVQKNNYNSNVGGNLNKRVQSSVSSEQAYAVVAGILGASVTPEQIENQIVPDIAALATVTDVIGDQLAGIGPTAIIPADHECRLYITTMSGGDVSGGAGESFGRTVKGTANFKVIVDRKWAIFSLLVPDVLNTAEIDTLEAEIATVTGVTLARHITDGVVPERQSEPSPLYVNAHMRIEPIEV